MNELFARLMERVDRLEKKLDAGTPSLKVDEITDYLEKHLKDSLEVTIRDMNKLTKEDLAYLRKTAEEELYERGGHEDL